MRIIHYQKVEATNADENASKLKVRWLITKQMGAPNFAMRLFEMEPGGHSPLHSHPWEHEIFIIQGEGLAISEQGEKKIGAGNAIYISPNEKHQLKNNGKATLKFLCFVPHMQE